MSRLIDVIIPTWNNAPYLSPCVQSLIAHTGLKDSMRIIVVNNGDEKSCDFLPKHPSLVVLNTGKNLGWEGGLKRGLEESDAEFVCFMNDDTFIPFSSHFWLNYVLPPFSDRRVAAVGPCTNVVMGPQNIFFGNDTADPFPDASYLIGYCMIVRRKYLDEVGGVDDTLPGGDDLDLSIRFRKAGYKLKIARSAFVYHHGFKTGERVRGHSDRPGGWNSREMTERTNKSLIQKHGFRNFIDCLMGRIPRENTDLRRMETERDVVRTFLKGEKMVELGCGGDKVDASAIGVDRIPKGETVPHMNGVKSQADYVADVAKPLPFTDGTMDCVIARHILEHCIDPLETIGHWTRLLKPDGRLIISVPDQRHCSSIPLNPEHVHAYTPESLDRLLSVFGFKKVGFKDNYNGLAMTACYERGE